MDLGKSGKHKKTILLAEHSGFCFGVKEAIRRTEEVLKEYAGLGVPIYTKGALIHNKAVTDELEAKGAKIIEDITLAPAGSIVIIRSHGEPKSFYEEAESRGIRIVDATCPFVKKIHRLVERASEEGRHVVIAGDKNHPEVIGISGWAENADVVGTTLEAGRIENEKITLVAQTTITEEMWDAVVTGFKNRIDDLVLHNTICSATCKRQESCRKIAQKSDVMVIIGDKRSSNSQKLFKIAQIFCKKSIFVERKEDLPLKDVEFCNKIGIAAGASTPERIIKEVIAVMSELNTETMELQEQNMEETKDNTEEVQAAEIVEEQAADNAVEEAAEEVNAPQEEVVPVQEEEANQMNDLMDEIEKSLRLPGRNEIVEGEVVQVSNREVVVNLGCKKDGVIPKEEMTLESGQELTDLFKEGDMVQAKVIKTDDGDGNILLSKKKLEVNEHWDEINAALDNKEVVNVKVVKEVKGGVIAVYKEVSGFIPMSQLSDHYVEKADEFIGSVLPVRVSRVDQKRNKAVFSHKAYLEEEKTKRIKEIWEALNVGDIVEGVVMRFTDYGAFVDIGGLDGLLHISEISWGKLKHPKEALEINQRINVKILSMNEEKGKISLGLKQTTPEPWSVIDEKYHIDQVVSGKVVQIKEYGAFVELEPGLDGLVHISEIAHKRVNNIADELTVGQTVNAKILEIDRDRKRISLSIKETIDDSIFDETADDDQQAEEIQEEPVMEAPVEEAAPVEEPAVEEAEAEEPAAEEADA